MQDNIYRGDIHVRCTVAEDLQHFVVDRLPKLVAELQQLAVASNKELKWFAPPHLSRSEISLETETIGDSVTSGELYEFFADCNLEDHPSVQVTSDPQLQRYLCNIGLPLFNAAPHLYKKSFIDFLVQPGEQKLAFLATVGIKACKNVGFPYQPYMFYYSTCDGNAKNLGNEDQLNPELSENTYISPSELVQRYC